MKTAILTFAFPSSDSAGPQRYSWIISTLVSLNRYVPDADIYCVDNTGSAWTASLGSIKVNLLKPGTPAISHSLSIIHGIKYLIGLGFDKVIILDQDVLINGRGWYEALRDSDKLITGIKGNGIIYFNPNSGQSLDSYVHMANCLDFSRDLFPGIENPLWSHEFLKLGGKKVESKITTVHSSIASVDLRYLAQSIPHWDSLIMVKTSRTEMSLVMNRYQEELPDSKEFPLAFADCFISLAFLAKEKGISSEIPESDLKNLGIVHAWSGRYKSLTRFLSERPGTSEWYPHLKGLQGILNAV